MEKENPIWLMDKLEFIRFVMSIETGLAVLAKDARSELDAGIQSLRLPIPSAE